MDRVRTWLRRGGTSPSWVWWFFRLWRCKGCKLRYRTGDEALTHELRCVAARAFDGQG